LSAVSGIEGSRFRHAISGPNETKGGAEIRVAPSVLLPERLRRTRRVTPVPLRWVATIDAATALQIAPACARSPFAWAVSGLRLRRRRRHHRRSLLRAGQA